MRQPPPGERRAIDAQNEPPAPRSSREPQPRVVSSEELLCGQSQLAIRHNEAIYVLRQTRLGKLILTK